LNRCGQFRTEKICFGKQNEYVDPRTIFSIVNTLVYDDKIWRGKLGENFLLVLAIASKV